MRFAILCVAAAVAVLPTPSRASGQGQNPPAQPQGWVTELFIQRLEDGFVERPEDARMSGQVESPWSLQTTTDDLPADLANRPFVNESFVLLEVGARGEAAGCRSLRPSAEPRLDGLACQLLMRPGFFRAYLGRLRGDVPSARWVMGVRFQTLDTTTAAARQAEALRPLIVPTTPTPARSAEARLDPAREEAASGEPRRAIRGHLSATDYLDLTDEAITNGDFLAELAVDVQGIPTRCRVARSSGNAAVDARTCELLMEGARYSLRRDADGNLIAGTVTQPVDVAWLLGRRSATR